MLPIGLIGIWCADSMFPKDCWQRKHLRSSQMETGVLFNDTMLAMNNVWTWVSWIQSMERIRSLLFVALKFIIKMEWLSSRFNWLLVQQCLFFMLRIIGQILQTQYFGCLLLRLWKYLTAFSLTLMETHHIRSSSTQRIDLFQVKITSILDQFMFWIQNFRVELLDLHLCIGIYLGHSLMHAGSIALVFNLQTENVSQEYHAIFDDTFFSVTFIKEGTIPPNWNKIFLFSWYFIQTIDYYFQRCNSWYSPCCFWSIQPKGVNSF